VTNGHAIDRAKPSEAWRSLSLVRPDGRIVTVCCFNGPRDEDRAIEATVWRP
jgi:hypothetical protein